jgi:PAS domain S-box-containing protein
MIHNRTQAQQADLGEQMPRDILESLPITVVILTPEGHILFINQASLKTAQIQREEVLGKPFAETHWWSYAPAAQQQVRAAIGRASRGETVHFEARIRSGAGKYLERAATITPHLDRNGCVEYLIYTGSDITARKQAENDLRALMDAMPQLIWIGRPDGYVEYHNQRWRDYTQVPLEHAQGDEWLQCLHPDDWPTTLAAWGTAIQTGEAYEVEQRLRNGTTGAYQWFLARGAPYKNAQGTIVKWIGTLTDIDGQKQAEQTLKASEERFRILAETVPQFVWATRPDGYLEYWNQQYADYFHASPEQLQGYAWRQFLHPDERDAVIAVRSHSLVTGEPYKIEYRLREGRTGAYRWFLVRGAPVRDEIGRIVTWFGTCTDIEEQKWAEQRKDDFLSMASHELKTPLTSLKLQTQLLEKKLAKRGVAEAVPALTRMEGLVNHLERLVGELLDVSKIQAGKLEYIRETLNLDELIHEIAEAAQQMSATHSVKVSNVGPISIIGDRDRLGQVFTNLISNAIKYSPAASAVEIEVKVSTETVTVSVRDQGIGIPREQHEKIFERFYRAVAPNQKAFPGFGMGLYIVAEIVERHKGTITVESEMGKGSTFHVTLPLEKHAR